MNKQKKEIAVLAEYVADLESRIETEGKMIDELKSCLVEARVVVNNANRDYEGNVRPYWLVSVDEAIGIDHVTKGSLYPHVDRHGERCDGSDGFPVYHILDETRKNALGGEYYCPRCESYFDVKGAPD
jgi:hypothetical protein